MTPKELLIKFHFICSAARRSLILETDYESYIQNWKTLSAWIHLVFQSVHIEFLEESEREKIFEGLKICDNLITKILEVAESGDNEEVNPYRSAKRMQHWLALREYSEDLGKQWRNT